MQNHRYFVSYAHVDARLVRIFLTLLRPRLAILDDHTFTEWSDAAIVIGEGWHSQIQQALHAADFGLLLISPEFLASSYIQSEELARMVDPATGRPLKPAVPVMLQPVSLDGPVDLRGLQHLQIFRDREGRAFSETRGATRDRFVDALVAALVRKLESRSAA